jgi:hypothetical protein
MDKLHNFASISDFISSDTLLALKQECFSISNYPGSEKNFWFSFDRPPSNIIEDYIWKASNHIGFDSSIIGAEWWVRCFKKSFMDHPFHIDLDVSSSVEENIIKTPKFSSVLYLTNDGGPTVITNSAKYEEAEKFDFYPSTPSVVWVSNPKAAKFIYWSKTYIHGVFGGKNFVEPRTTLMFNLWTEKPKYPECRMYDLPHKISQSSAILNSTDYDIIKPVLGQEDTYLKIKGDRNMVKCKLVNGLPAMGTYLVVNS